MDPRPRHWAVAKPRPVRKNKRRRESHSNLPALAALLADATTAQRGQAGRQAVSAAACLAALLLLLLRGRRLLVLHLGLALRRTVVALGRTAAVLTLGRAVLALGRAVVALGSTVGLWERGWVSCWCCAVGGGSVVRSGALGDSLMGEGMDGTYRLRVLGVTTAASASAAAVVFLIRHVEVICEKGDCKTKTVRERI